MDADPITSGLTGETFTTSGDPIVDAATPLLVRSTTVAAPQQSDTRAADLAVIQKLHKADEECTLAHRLDQTELETQ